MSRARRRRAIRVSREYAVSPERLWRAISERDQIARWLMPNDFEPRVGHRFTMKSDPAPGFDGRVECEVLALDPPTRMIWGWRGGPIDTTVTFTVEPSPRGARLTIVQEGFEGVRGALTRLVLLPGWWSLMYRHLPRALLD
jgi:uncharacterized protein YndB with AHSA1/START domain